jgi:4-amino-4-deoxy-L-arabinose transferase-like glycosyltransferase
MPDSSIIARQRTSFLLLALLFIAWQLPGLVGRSPWKSDEAYTVGLVHHIIESGDVVVPTLAGEPFVQKPLR